MKKLILVTPYYHPKPGGLETYARNIASKIKPHTNWSVSVVTSNHVNNTDIVDMVDGVKVYRLKTNMKLSNTPIGFDWYSKMKSIFLLEQANLINAHSPVPYIADISLLVAKKLGIPHTVTYHSGGFKKGQVIPDFITSIYSNSFERFLFSQTDVLFTLSDFVKNTYLRNYSSKTVTIQPAINKTGSLPRQKPYNKKVIFVGNLSKAHSWKGLSDAIISLTFLDKAFSLDVIGDGNNLEFYKHLAKDFKVSNRTRFLGQINNDDVGKYLKQADIALLLSVSNAESLGISLLEAMSYGLPIVGTKVGGIPYTVKEGVNGILVQPRDPKAVASAISRLFSNHEIYRKMSTSNIKQTERMSWDKHVDELLGVFEEITT